MGGSRLPSQRHVKENVPRISKYDKRFAGCSTHTFILAERYCVLGGSSGRSEAAINIQGPGRGMVESKFTSNRL